jgi:hemerythrin superfamily protein
MEEKLFYPWVLAKQTEDILRESTEEHLQIKRVLADLLALDPGDEQFDAKLSVMKEEITHHAREEEEGELFPKVRKMASKEDLDALGGEMLALFEEILATEPAKKVPSETSHAAPL